MITIGFTGTRNGMTDQQKRTVSFLVSEVFARCNLAGDECRGLHGDCVGADADFAAICSNLGVTHQARPCTFENMRAHASPPIAAPIRPMERNRAIVADATVMIACPPNDTPIKSGSGTWATIGFSDKANKPIAVCWPEGDYAFEMHRMADWCRKTHGDQIRPQEDESVVSERIEAEET